jgi:regulator of protease activity HflC (stomatin/prohibitin superfamily)
VIEILVIAAVALILSARAIRIVREYERVVVFRLGRPRGARGPGLVLIIPLTERTRWVNLQVDTADIPPQDLITKDNVAVRVEAAVSFRVIDPVKAVVAIRDYQHGCFASRRRCSGRRLASTSSTIYGPTRPGSKSCSRRSSTRPPSLGA